MARPDLYPTVAPEKSYAPDKWTARHRLICQLHTIGWSNKEIAERLGMSDGRISTILSDPRAQLDITAAVASVADNIVDLHTRIKAHAVEALDEIVDEIRNSTDEKVRQRAAFGILDRAGYTPVQKHMSVAPELPMDVAERVKAAIAESIDDVEEVEYEVVQPGTEGEDFEIEGLDEEEAA